MIIQIKPKIDETKQFIQKHKTAVACVITALMTYKMTHEYMLEVSRDYVYQLGRNAGMRDTQLAILLEFINANGLQTELYRFVNLLND